MTKPRLAFIDWMKFLGMLLIVIGHVSWWTDNLLPPIYPKQLGVAFFLFVSGLTLARETRPSREVIVNRLFEIYLFGIGIALIVTTANYMLFHRLALSNYLPFLLGLNVVFDNFPANSTTWYIGTYIHVLLIWALFLRRVRIKPWTVILVIAAELCVRVILIEAAGRFIAYMAVSNWASVFLMGISSGQKVEDVEPDQRPTRYLLGLGLLIVAWPFLAGTLHPQPSFPFMRSTLAHGIAGVGITSAAVSCAYIVFTWLIYQVTRRLPASRIVRFFARNTMIVFIAHMPLFYVLRTILSEWTVPYFIKTLISFLACFPLLAIISEAVRFLVRPARLREMIVTSIRTSRGDRSKEKWQAGDSGLQPADTNQREHVLP